MKKHGFARLFPAGRRKNRLFAAGLLVLMLVGFASGYVYGRYVQGQDKTGTITAKDFYFTSDFLTEENEPYVLNAGTKEVTFLLKNHKDALNWSDDALTYTISVTGGAAVKDGMTSGTIANDQANSVAVTLENLEDGSTYEVTVTGSAGYQKVLKATFTVKEPEKLVYKYIDTANPHFVLLTVWTQNVKGNVMIEKIPANLQPNNLDSGLATAVSGQSGYTDAVSFAATEGGHTYQFFKQDPDDSFTLVDFGKITVGGVEAIVEP